jgi:lipopolysaccharide export system protein LptA
MTLTARAIAASLVLALLGAASPALAQLSEQGGPVSYSADTLEYFDAERRLVLTGDVDLIQADARLRADRLTLYFAPAAASAAPSPGAAPGLGSGDIQRMIAEGEVYFVRPTQSARGNRAVYDTAQGDVTFTGNVVVASADNVIRGETMVLRIDTRQTTIRPAPGERVRGVLVQQSEPAAAPSAPNSGGR